MLQTADIQRTATLNSVKMCKFSTLAYPSNNCELMPIMLQTYKSPVNNLT